ncbi:MAG: hypothetical protein V7646_2279 [Pseudonocardia sp.]
MRGMRKFGVACAVAGLVALAAPSAALADVQQTGQSYEVFGAGKSELNTYFGFDIRGGTMAADASGTATFWSGGAQRGTYRRGDVTCLNVVGNQAVFSIRNPATNANQRFYVQDAGDGTVQSAVDRLTQISAGSGPQDCTIPSGESGLVLQGGDITIRAAS